MDEQQKQDKTGIKELISQSRLEMPYPDFENRVMAQIRERVQSERTIDKNIRLSWLFFALGTIFGLFLSVIISPVTTILGFPASRLEIPAFIVGGTIILLLLEQMLKFTLSREKRDLHL